MAFVIQIQAMPGSMHKAREEVLQPEHALAAGDASTAGHFQTPWGTQLGSYTSLLGEQQSLDHPVKR